MNCFSPRLDISNGELDSADASIQGYTAISRKWQLDIGTGPLTTVCRLNLANARCTLGGLEGVEAWRI